MPTSNADPGVDDDALVDPSRTSTRLLLPATRSTPFENPRGRHQAGKARLLQRYAPSVFYLLCPEGRGLAGMGKLSIIGFAITYTCALIYLDAPLTPMRQHLGPAWAAVRSRRPASGT